MLPPHVQLAPVRLLGVALASETLAVFYSLAAVCREGGGPGAVAARPACAVRLLGAALASVVFGLLPPLRALVFEQTLAWTAMIGSQSVHDVQGTYERQAQEAECY